MATPRVTEIRMFSVYKHGQSLKTNPSWVVDRKTASYLLDCAFARRSSKWVLILAKDKPLQVRDDSCSIRERIIVSAVDGSNYHKALIRVAWGPKRCPTPTTETTRTPYIALPAGK